MIQKSLRDISWQVTEPEYRADSGISYSTLAKYERDGFNKLSSLFDRVESPSLLFGSLVDTKLTGTEEEFNELYYVCDFPKTDDSIIKIINYICNNLPEGFVGSLSDVSDVIILNAAVANNYQMNWKPETRVKVIKEKGSDYFMMKLASNGKTVVSSELYTQVMNCVDALKTSEATAWYFQEDNPFDDIERLYQLKFKGEYEGIPIRCMADLIIADHSNKIIYFNDLKTSSHTEWDFPESFIDWKYMIQGSMYSYIIKQNMMKDDYFKDFKLMPYRFIVVNKNTVTPLVWEFGQTFCETDIVLGDKTYRNWRVILKELYHYLQDSPKIPDGIFTDKPNSIEEYFKK